METSPQPPVDAAALLDQARAAIALGDWGSLCQLIQGQLIQQRSALYSAAPYPAVPSALADSGSIPSGSMQPGSMQLGSAHADLPADTSTTAIPQRPQDLQQRALALTLQLWEVGDFHLRWDLAKLLVGWGDRAIVPLTQVLQDEQADWELRWFAARALGEFADPLALQALIQTLQAPDDDLALVAAETLARMGPAAIAPLSQLLRHSDSRLLAVQALAQIRHSQTIPPLIDVVTDVDPRVRSYALEALSSFNDPRLLPVFTAALQDPITTVRSAALVGLSLRPQWVKDSNLLPQICDRLWDVNLTVCQQAAIALGRIGGEEAVQALAAALHTAATPPTLQSLLIQALTWTAQPEALKVLAQIAQPQFAEPLPTPGQPGLDASGPSDPFTRSRFPGNSAVYLTLIESLGQWQAAEWKPQALEILVSMLQPQAALPGNPSSRASIATALGQLGLIQARDPLIELLAEPDLSVRLHAIAALKRLPDPELRNALVQLSQRSDLAAALREGLAIALREWPTQTAKFLPPSSSPEFAPQ